jgi:hypothetical protein
LEILNSDHFGEIRHREVSVPFLVTGKKKFFPPAGLALARTKDKGIIIREGRDEENVCRDLIISLCYFSTNLLVIYYFITISKRRKWIL